MITCTTTFLSSALSHYTSPVPLQSHFELINSFVTSFKFVLRTFQNDLALDVWKRGSLFAFVPEPTSSQKLISITLFLSHAMMDFLPSLKARLMLSQPLSEWWMPCWAIIMRPSTKVSSLAFPPIRLEILMSGALHPDRVAGTFSAWFILELRVSSKVDWISVNHCWYQPAVAHSHSPVTFTTIPESNDDQLTVLDTNQCNQPDSPQITESVH